MSELFNKRKGNNNEKKRYPTKRRKLSLNETIINSSYNNHRLFSLVIELNINSLKVFVN